MNRDPDSRDGPPAERDFVVQTRARKLLQTFPDDVPGIMLAVEGIAPCFLLFARPGASIVGLDAVACLPWFTAEWHGHGDISEFERMSAWDTDEMLAILKTIDDSRLLPCPKCGQPRRKDSRWCTSLACRPQQHPHRNGRAG